MSVTVEPTQYVVTAVPADLQDHIDADCFQLTIERRARDKWAVIRRTMCWDDTTQKWVSEPTPSSRSDKFKARTRYPLDMALAIAQRLAPEQRIMGLTIDAWVERVRQDQENQP